MLIFSVWFHRWEDPKTRTIPKAQEKKLPMTKRPKWIAGIVIVIIAAIVDFSSMAFAGMMSGCIKLIKLHRRAKNLTPTTFIFVDSSSILSSSYSKFHLGI